jgi:hypothetical protein
LRGRQRFVTLVLTISLGVFVAIPVAFAHEFAYADSFPEQSYSNNTGSLVWSGSWYEIGESDGPTTGTLQVASSNCSGKCLVLDAPLELPTSKGLARGADLTDAERVELYYTMKRQPGSLPLGTLYVQMRKAGQSWNTVKQHDLSTPDGSFIPYTFDVSGYAGYQVELRFLLDVVSLNTRVAINEVELGIEYPATTTTTTTASTTTTKKPATTTSTTRPSTTSTSTSSTTTTSTTVVGETTTTTEPRTDTSAVVIPPTDPTQPPGDGDGRIAETAPRPSSTVESAEVSGVALNMSPVGSTRFVTARGLNPLTSLTPGFRSVVEAIQSEFLSALGLASVVAFFALRLPSQKEEEIRVP